MSKTISKRTIYLSDSYFMRGEPAGYPLAVTMTDVGSNDAKITLHLEGIEPGGEEYPHIVIDVADWQGILEEAVGYPLMPDDR